MEFYKMPVIPTTLFLSSAARINYNGASGTGTILNVSELLFLITCQHLVRGIQAGDNIGIRHGNSWKLINIQEVIIPEDGADIAALQIGERDNNFVNDSRINDKIVFGEQVLFCGFPLGLEVESGDTNNGFPLPLVKSGVFSGFGNVNGRRMLFFDAHNNAGFSGGPIITGMHGIKSLRIAGIVQGYKFDRLTPVIKEHEPGKFEEADGYFVQTNSDFMYGISISDIVKAIKMKT